MTSNVQVVKPRPRALRPTQLTEDQREHIPLLLMLLLDHRLCVVPAATVARRCSFAAAPRLLLAATAAAAANEGSRHSSSSCQQQSDKVQPSHCSMTEAAPTPGTAEQGMDVAKHGWYTELGSMWPGQGLSLRVKEVLHRARSDFQDVCVFESEAYGRVLLLDGVIQATERDEFSYQEMLAHLPLCALETPAKRALVVGGGDGGVLRELARHTSLEEIHIAEIDGAVPEVSKRFFPGMAVGFSDPRVKVHICDGIKFVEEAPEGHYDVIIVDSSDPVGPAEVLFQQPFFEAMHRALRPGGLVCTQAESLWLHLEVIRSLADMCSRVFAGGSVAYAYTTIPTYPSGQIGMMVCCKGQPLDVRVPRQPPPGPVQQLGIPALRYYTPELHRAAFVLPRYAHDALRDSLTHT